MKFKSKILLVSLITTLMMIATQEVNAQVTKKNEKQEEKQGNKNYKGKVAELESEGWKITGDHRTLELAIIEHQNKIDGNKEIYGSAVGEVNKCGSIDGCKQMVTFQAQREILNEINAEMKGVGGQVSNLDYMTGDEFNNLINNTVRYSQADISGVLIPSYSLIKENGDGKYSFRTIYIVDLNKKRTVQTSALEKALKETKISIEQSESIQKMVLDAFDAKKSEETE